MVHNGKPSTISVASHHRLFDLRNGQDQTRLPDPRCRCRHWRPRGQALCPRGLPRLPRAPQRQGRAGQAGGRDRGRGWLGQRLHAQCGGRRQHRATGLPHRGQRRPDRGSGVQPGRADRRPGPGEHHAQGLRDGLAHRHLRPLPPGTGAVSVHGAARQGCAAGDIGHRRNARQRRPAFACRGHGRAAHAVPVIERSVRAQGHPRRAHRHRRRRGRARHPGQDARPRALSGAARRRRAWRTTACWYRPKWPTPTTTWRTSIARPGPSSWTCAPTPTWPGGTMPTTPTSSRSTPC